LDSAGFVGNRRLRDDERDGVLLSVVFDAVRGVEPVVVPVGFEVEVFDAPNVACLNSGIDADLLSFEFPSLRTVPSGFVFRALQGCWACSLAFQLPLGGSPDSFSRVAMPGKVELPNINSESGSSTFEFTISRRVASGGKPRLSRQNRSSLNWNCNSPAGTARRTSLVPTRLHPRPLFLFARSSRSPILADLHRIRSQRGQGRLQFADG